jgi:hypothetical protein
LVAGTTIRLAVETRALLIAPGHFERDGVLKLGRGHERVDAGWRQLPLFDQMQLVVPEVVQPSRSGRIQNYLAYSST